MSTVHHDFADILLRQRAVTREQLDEARYLANQTCCRLENALLKLGHVTAVQVLIAWSEARGVGVINLDGVMVPPAIVELVPESVARENILLPLGMTRGVLNVAICDPDYTDLLEKLQFILNRTVRPLLALREQLVEAIDRHYGPSETESVDSMLAELTDTAIDFTQTEVAARPGDECELECPFDLELAVQSVAPPPVRPLVGRRATVRYYHRVNPERMFPLLVILSGKAVREVARRGVSQQQSETFGVEQGSLVEIEPILPGCACYPPREQVRIGPAEVAVTFWVVPHVLGKVMQARVVVRQDGQTLAEVPVQMRVVKQSLTVLMGALGLVLPFVLLLLKHFKLDFESQLQEGFGVYAQVAGWLLRSLTPEVLAGVLLAGTAALYLWLRPRKREVFWDVQTAGPEEADLPAPRLAPAFDSAGPLRQAGAAGELRPEGLLEALLACRRALLDAAGRCDRAGDHAAALKHYEQVLGLGEARAVDYFWASLTAYKTGNLSRALGILRQAEHALPATEMNGPLWYNMGCFASRLGQFPEALRCLNRAVDLGYADAAKYRCDPDLEALRWHAGFKRLLAGMPCSTAWE